MPHIDALRDDDLAPMTSLRWLAPDDDCQAPEGPENPVKTPAQLREMIRKCSGLSFTDAETLRLILFDIVDTFVAAIGASDGESTTTHQSEEKP